PKAREKAAPAAEVAEASAAAPVDTPASDEPAAAPAPAPVAKAAPAPALLASIDPTEAPAAARQTKVEDVRFDEKDGFYRLKISGIGPMTHHVSVDNPRLKVLEIEQADLPKGLERSLDTTAFAGPVQAVATFKDPDRPGIVKVAVDLGKGVEHRVW